MRHCLMLLSILVLSVACTPSKPRQSDFADIRQPISQEYLVRMPSFTNCELQAFITLTAGRQAIVFGVTKETLLAAKDNGEFQIDMINEIYKRMTENGFRDYPMFAAEKFYQCAGEAGISVKQNLNAAAVCLARQDIPFYTYTKKHSGATQSEATAFLKSMYENSSKEIYPESLIEQTVQMVYRVKNAKDFYEIRRLSFETCLFPDEWKAWWEHEQAVKR